MADVAKVLRLVEEGALTPEEAERILAALGDEQPPPPAADRAHAVPHDPVGPVRHLRIEVTDHGRQVVNLRVPINVASFAAGIVPGLSDEEAERIRQSIRSGARGPIVDITSEDGDRVLIVTE